MKTPRRNGRIGKRDKMEERSAAERRDEFKFPVRFEFDEFEFEDFNFGGVFVRGVLRSGIVRVGGRNGS